MPTWFRRLGDIQGVDVSGLPAVDRSKVRDHDAVPEVHEYEFDGERRQSLWWGETSASPARDRLEYDVKAVSTQEVLRNLAEALEVPGEPSDYHFLLQGTAEQLWSRRKHEPDVVRWVLKLCQLDMALIAAQPDAVTDDTTGDFYRISSISLAVRIYEREGYLREALEICDWAARFGQCADERTKLQERLSALEAEVG